MSEFVINSDHILVKYEGAGGAVTVPEGVKAIGGRAFTHESRQEITQVVLPEGLETIGFSAFEGCSNLTSITLPRSLKEIGHDAFKSCKNLNQIDLPVGIQAIGEKAFAFCNGLTEVVLPEGLTEVGRNLFMWCENLKRVTLPGSVTTIGPWAFVHCHALEEILLPAGLSSIGDEAFSNCWALTTIRIPDGITTLPRSLLNGCSKLENVSIADSVTEIKAFAIYDCASLTSLVIPQNVRKVEHDLCSISAIQMASMPRAVFDAWNWKTAARINAGLAVCEDGKWQFYGYAAKANCDNFTDFVRRGKWNAYDLDLINNGPAYKYKAPARLLGALGRIADPVDLTDECQELHMEFLIKNAKKLIPIAESLRCPAIVEAMKEHGIINDKNKKAIAKLLAASNVPEIAALTV